MKLIDKDALVAEIDNMLKTKEQTSHLDNNAFNSGRWKALKKVKDILDTLEVKVTDEVKIGETQIYLEDDGGEQPYDGKQWLDLSCIEYEIPKALFNEGDNVEILIRKTQKGE